MKKILVIVGIAVAVLAIVGFGLFKWGTGKYNQMITLGQNVDKSWSQVENVLQRRNDLIPNLVNVVQAYAIQEQEVFIKVAQARSAWMRAVQSGSIADKIQADSVVTGTLATLMATVERYPELKSNENFLALQDELAGTENRISVERMRYNEAVQGYNTAAKVFPNNLLVKFLSLTPEREYFKAVEGAQSAPVVNINVTPAQQQVAPIAAPVTETQLPPPPTAAAAPAMPAPANAPTIPQVIPATGLTPPTPVQPTAPAAPAPQVAPAPAAPAAVIPTPNTVAVPKPEPTPMAAPVPTAPVAPTQPVAPSATAPAAPVQPTAPAPVAPAVPVTPPSSINVTPPTTTAPAQAPVAPAAIVPSATAPAQAAAPAAPVQPTPPAAPAPVVPAAPATK